MPKNSYRDSFFSPSLNLKKKLQIVDVSRNNNDTFFFFFLKFISCQSVQFCYCTTTAIYLLDFRFDSLLPIGIW